MYEFDFPYRVTYADTDKMGYLYYGNYATLYEIGRVETMRSMDIHYKELEQTHNIMMPVVSVEARFLKPALYDELLKIRTIIPEMPSKMVTFQNEIYNPDYECLHKAIVKLFFIDMKTQSRVSCPEWMMQTLKKYF